MFTKPVRCDACGKLYQARSKKTTCPHCEKAAPVPAGPPADAPIANTLVDTFAAQPIAPITELPCPKCAETIKAAAKECRFCGHELGRSVRAPSSGRHQAIERRPARAVAPARSSSVGTIVVVVAVLAVVGVGAIFMVNGKPTALMSDEELADEIIAARQEDWYVAVRRSGGTFSQEEVNALKNSDSARRARADLAERIRQMRASGRRDDELRAEFRSR